MLKQLNQRFFDLLSRVAKGNFYQGPTKKTVVLFGCVWLVGSLLCVLAMTDSFTVSPFQPRYTLLLFLFLASTASMARLVVNYIRNSASTTYR